MKYFMLILACSLAACSQKPKLSPSMGPLPSEFNEPLKELTQLPTEETPNNVVLARHAQLRKDFSDNLKSCKFRTVHAKERNKKANQQLRQCSQ